MKKAVPSKLKPEVGSTVSDPDSPSRTASNVQLEKSKFDDVLVQDYSPETVAQIAATLFAGRGFALRRDESYLKAASAAIALLEACDDEVRWHRYMRGVRQQTSEEKAALAKEQATLNHKYPDGRVPWLKGLLFVTGCRSELDGLSVFRQWKSFELDSRQRSHRDSGDSELSTPVAAEADIAGCRQRGFQTAELPSLRVRFEKWKEVYHLPRVRREAGRASGAARKSKKKPS